MRLKYNLLQFFRDREVMFFSLMMPMIMGTIFFFAIGPALFADEETGTIPVAIVEQGPTTALNQSFLELAHHLEAEERFALTFLNYEGAIGLMHAEQVVGVVVLGETIELVIQNAGVQQNILESIVNEFTINAATIENIAGLRPEYMAEALAAFDSYTTVNRSVRDIPVNAMTNFFFLILAMGSFSSSIRGLKMGCELQAHTSNTAARLSVAPTKKVILIIENLITAVVMQTMASILTILFYVFILGINFGTEWGLIIVACLAGSFASIAFGLFFSVAVPGTIDTKGGFLAIFTYASMFAGGIFGVQLRNLVRTSFPLLDRINMMAIISDTFLTLVLHEDLSRFIYQLTILVGIGIVCSIAGAVILRRKSYANI